MTPSPPVLAIDHDLTADMNGRPMPPLIDEDVVWQVVRHFPGATIWRRIHLVNEHLSTPTGARPERS